MSAPAATSSLVVVTDLDGTLLDAETYSLEAARDALRALATRGARLVLATSKTRAELEPLAGLLGMPAAWVVETGGAVIIPPAFLDQVEDVTSGQAREEVIVLGTTRPVLIDHLKAISRETGVPLRGFADLGVDAIAELTGLSIEAAARANQRDYDEPFLIPSPDLLPLVDAAARRRGLVVTSGGRFPHLTGPTDKGHAVRVLLDVLRRKGLRPWTIGLGDAPNDASFLAMVDQAVIVPRPDHVVDPRLAAAVPQANVAPAPGPEGWNAALLALLDGRALPRLAEQP